MLKQVDNQSWAKVAGREDSAQHLHGQIDQPSPNDRENDVTRKPEWKGNQYARYGD